MQPKRINNLNTMKILGVRVSCATREDVLQIPLGWAKESEKRTILYVNAHCLNLATQDLAYRDLLNRADMVYSDGISVVWAAQWLGGCQLEKVTGRDWIHDFSERAAQENLRFYILAGKPGIAEGAHQNLIRQYPDLQIVGTQHGYFHEAESTAIITAINQAAPDILFVGRGTPRQEKWLAANRGAIQAPVCWAVGALFDYVAGAEPPVPAWLNRLALEWLWRMTIDPIGKWRRYVIGNPRFLYHVLRQKFGAQY